MILGAIWDKRWFRVFLVLLTAFLLYRGYRIVDRLTRERRSDEIKRRYLDDFEALITRSIAEVSAMTAISDRTLGAIALKVFRDLRPSFLNIKECNQQEWEKIRPAWQPIRKDAKHNTGDFSDNPRKYHERIIKQLHDLRNAARGTHP